MPDEFRGMHQSVQATLQALVEDVIVELKYQAEPLKNNPQLAFLLTLMSLKPIHGLEWGLQVCRCYPHFG